MTSEDVAELEDSTSLKGNPAALRQRWNDNGYLFFRDVMDPPLIARAHERFREALAKEGLVDPDASAPIWTGAEPKTRRPCDSIGDVVWKEITARAPLNDLLRDLMDEEPVWVPIVAHRSSLPGGPVKEGQDIFAGRHQDGFFNEGIEFVISWLPLMDIDRKNGGLTVAEGSHKLGYMHDFSVPPKYPIPPGAIPEDMWRTADFRVGDVLMFHHKTAHTGLPNQTDMIRLSIDVRAIPESAARPVVGAVTKVEGANILIHTEKGDVPVTVDENTYIRLMDPKPRIPIDQLDRVAYVGAKVIAMVGDGNVATVLRTNFY